MATSVHQREGPQPQFSDDRMKNKLKAEQKGQPTNKQHSPRNDQGQMPKPHTNLSTYEKFKFLKSIDVEVENLEDTFKHVRNYFVFNIAISLELLDSEKLRNNIFKNFRRRSGMPIVA